MKKAAQFILMSSILSAVHCDANYRLNPRLTPSEYDITITPYFNTETDPFTFDGEVTIKVTATEEGVKQIKLHSEDLKFTAENVTVRDGNKIIALNETNAVEYEAKYFFVYVNLATALTVNTVYEVNILYRGPIRSDMSGFYFSSYIQNGQKKWAGATQMEPVHTRKVFPCFDEPEYKARFTLAIDRPEGYQPSLANTRIQNTTILNNGYIRDRFYPTPNMSCYLVAFLVSEFQTGASIETGDREFGVWVRPDATNQTDYAFDVGKRVVAALSNYTGIDYYSVDSNLKLDHVGLPDFRAGAMENWGLIKYRESLLLYVPEESTPYYKYRVAQIIAHETAHMWFGDLVTCHWWSDTWLNEGFANYFQDYITAEVEPELGSADLLVTSSVYQAYNYDQTPVAVAMSSEVHSPDEISAHFGAVSYQKAGSVIRTIHHWVGDEAFKLGLNVHLNAASLNVVYPDDLYASLQTGVSFTGSLSAYPGHTVASVMRPWVTQAGFPLLHVGLNRTSGAIVLTQNRFYLNSSYESDELYPIPITYTTARAWNFDDTKPALIMSERSKVLPGPFSDDEWVIFNVQETGYYRVNYDDHLWSLIGEVLRGENRTKIHYLNRAKIVSDVFELAHAGHVEFRVAFDQLDFLAQELEYSVWLPALAALEALRKMLLPVGETTQLETYTLRLLENVIADLGFDEREGDSFVTLRNRMLVTECACKFGHQGCQKHALAVFRQFIDNGTPVPPSLRPVVYCHGLKQGSGEDYEVMHQRKMSTNVANEGLVIEAALGCSSHKDKLESYLSQMLSPESGLRDQDATTPLVSVLSIPDNFQLAFTFLRENYAALRNATRQYSTMSSIVSIFPAAISNEDDLDQFEEWLDSCVVCTEEETAQARATAQEMRARLAWARAHLTDIVQPLREKNHATAFSPPLAGMLVAFAAVAIFR